MIPISAPAIASLTTSRVPGSLLIVSFSFEVRGGGKRRTELTSDPIKVKRPADNDRAKQRPNKRAEPSISRLVADNDAKPSTSNSRD
jgi:hypothetical protein